MLRVLIFAGLTMGTPTPLFTILFRVRCSMRKHTPLEIDAIDAKIKKSGRGNHLHTTENLQKNQIPKVKTDNAPGENPFPVGVLPVSLRLIVHEYKRVTGAPTDFLAGAMLTVAGVAIGNSVRSKAGQHDVIAALFMCGVASSGTGKTHPQKVALAPLQKMDKESWKAYKQAHDRWKAAGADNTKKNKEPEPQPKLTVLTDATPESLIPIHESSPNALLYYRDELSGFINSFNQYSKGGESQMWLEIFNGSPVTQVRKKAGNARIDKPHISILGNIQPGLLPKLSANNRLEDGFMHRFLFLYPAKCEPMPLNFESVNGIAWNECITVIKQMLSGHDHENPVMIEPTPEAMKVLLNCDTRLMNEANNTTDETTKGILAKLRIYLHRFALILQAMECADTGEAFTAINTQAAAGAVKLVQYFQYTAEKVHGQISKESKRHFDIKRVHSLLERGKTVREIAILLDISKSTVSNYSKEKP